MTQSSAFWNGTTIGHAASGAYTAPYDAETEFNRIFSRALGSDSQGFVIPALLNNLNVQASAPVAATVDVATGAALIKGFHYLNDALVTLAIAANASGSPRIDRIVLRITWATKLVEVAIVQGTAAATPTVPALTQTYGTVWEMPLAYVWLANGFATIGNAEIHDERVFLQTPQAATGSDLTGHNLIVNSEFMAYSDLPTAPPTIAPEGWEIFGAIPTITGVTKYSGQPRGRALQMNAGGGNRGLQQTFNVPASTMIAIKVPINVTAGDVGEVVVTTNSASPQTITRTLRRTGAFVEEIIYYLTESDASTMTVKEYCVNNTDIVTIGQTLAVIGYFAGIFRQIHESIVFRQALTDGSWSFTAKSTGTTTITLSASFGSVILPGTQALFVALGGDDSGSAAGFPHISLYNPSIGGGPVAGPLLDLAGEGNSKPRYNDGVVGINTSLQFIAAVTATGAGTFAAFISIKGIMT